MAERRPNKATPSDAGMNRLLEHLKATRAFDFTGYRRATLTRRIDKRMEQVGIGSYDDYVDYLAAEPGEFEELFNTILINVTSFFRDPDTWDELRAQVVPDLISRDEIRVWSAGSASGQEAYSAVMMLADAIGFDGVKERVKVYATDVDNDALDQARQALYGAHDLEGVPEGYVERYFEETTRGFELRSDLRRAVVFGRHDLLVDAPISRVDLLLCRNTLMYFNSDVQAQLANRLHFALAEDGYLMLGRVEMLLGQGDLFQPVDMKHHIFRKVARTSLRTRLLAMASGGAVRVGEHVDEDMLLERAFESHTTAEVLLDGPGNVVVANAAARSMFDISLDLLGRPFQDIELSYRPVELRSWIDQARNERRPVSLKEIERRTSSGEQTYLDVEVVPLAIDDHQLGVLLTFTDVTRHRQLQEELGHMHRELETAYEELQSSSEELETTNEELQSTIEELETTNEELQSTNEELETMNEELSSTNEELQAINDELRERTSELNQVNAYMESVLTGLEASVILVDRDLQVQVWNGRSFEMWGVRADEVEGRGLMGLDVGLPVARLAEPIRECLTGTRVEVEGLEALTRRGVHARLGVQLTPLRGVDGDVEGCVIIVEDLGADGADGADGAEPLGDAAD